MLQIYQDSTYADLNPTWHEEDAPWKARQIERILRDNGVIFDHLCEIGCGTGDILLYLEKSMRINRLSGYEISAHAYRRAKLKDSSRTTFYLDDLAGKPELQFDVLLAIDVMEHVEDYIGFLKEIRTHARYKVIHIPLDLSVQSVLRQRPIMDLRRNVGHLHYFFKDSALATLTDCGYRIVDHVYTASRLELPNQALSSRIMRWPRKLLFKFDPDLTVRVLGGYSLLVLAE